jgi:hypothetical protein
MRNSRCERIIPLAQEREGKAKSIKIKAVVLLHSPVSKGRAVTFLVNYSGASVGKRTKKLAHH